MGNRWGNSGNIIIFLGSKITADGDFSHEIKRHLLLGRKVLTKLDNILKSRDIIYKKKSVRNTNTWRLNNTFLNNQQVTEEIKREIKKFLETNDNENTITQNLWDAAKAVLKRKFIAIQSYLKKEEKHQIDNLTLHLK